MTNTLWAVHIQGPDDLVPVADYLSAIRCANAFNAWWAGFKTEKPLHDYDPRMWASPVEWTGDIERHAEWAKNPSPDYACFINLAAQADYEQRIRAAIEIQSSDVEACRDCSEASRRDSSEPEPSTSVSNQYRKSIDRIYRSTDREIWSGEIQSSDGGVEGHAAVSCENRSTLESARKGSAAIAPSVSTSPHREDAAGIKPGPSEAIADVSVDELAQIIERAVIDDCKTKPGSAWLDGLQAASRALLARFRIERLDRLASSGRR